MIHCLITYIAYGTALKKLGEANERVCAFDGDTKNSTFSLKFFEAFPERSSECFIAEQNLAGVAIGAACRNRAVTFASTFAAFFSRAADQIRMGAISQTNANFCGSHAGISIGEGNCYSKNFPNMTNFSSSRFDLILAITNLRWSISNGLRRFGTFPCSSRIHCILPI